MARNLLKAWPALWTFAKHLGVEPTNNHAERTLRSAVIYRKLSFGPECWPSAPAPGGLRLTDDDPIGDCSQHSFELGDRQELQVWVG